MIGAVKTVMQVQEAVLFGCTREQQAIYTR